MSGVCGERILSNHEDLRESHPHSYDRYQKNIEENKSLDLLKSESNDLSSSPEKELGFLENVSSSSSEKEIESNKSSIADNERIVSYILEKKINMLEGASKKPKVSSLLKKLFQKVFKRDDPGEKCEEKKKSGQAANAMLGDSPVKSFGFGTYDQKVNATKLSPGVCLSSVNGYMQPIHLEASDFMLQGSADEINAFFECFEHYEIKGKDINMDTGKWEEENADICVQIENTDELMATMNTSAAEVLAKYTLKKITSKLSVMGLINSNAMEIVEAASPKLAEIYDHLCTLLEISTKMKSVYPSLSTILKTTVETLKSKDKTWEQKVQTIKDFLTNESSKSFIKENWKGIDYIDLEKKMIVTLTVHTRQDHKKRATFCTGKSIIPISVLGDAFEHLITNSPLKKLIEVATEK